VCSVDHKTQFCHFFRILVDLVRLVLAHSCSRVEGKIVLVMLVLFVRLVQGIV
jgi:hypothetical protein